MFILKSLKCEEEDFHLSKATTTVRNIEVLENVFNIKCVPLNNTYLRFFMKYNVFDQYKMPT